MRRAAYLSGYGRGAFGVVAAACLGLALAGCSSGVSRFDFPAFNLTGNDTPPNGGNADLASTSSLPPVLPEESVYSSGEGAPPRLTRANLPPPDYTPRPRRLFARAERTRRRRRQPTIRRQPRRGPSLPCCAPKVRGAHVKVAQGRHALDPVAPLRRSGREDHGGQQSARRAPVGRPGAGHSRREGAQGGGRGCSRRLRRRLRVNRPTRCRRATRRTRIADKLGVSEKALIARNKLNPSSLRIGQVLIVPGKSAKPVVAAKDDTPLAEPAVDTAPNVRKVKTTTIPAPGTSLAEEEDGPGRCPAATIGRQDARQRGERHSRFARGHRPGQPARRQQRPAADARADVGQQLPLAGEGPRHRRVRHAARWRPQ